MFIGHTAAPSLAKCYSFSLEGLGMKTSNPDAGGAFLDLIHTIEIPQPASLWDQQSQWAMDANNWAEPPKGSRLSTWGRSTTVIDSTVRHGSIEQICNHKTRRQNTGTFSKSCLHTTCVHTYACVHTHHAYYLSHNLVIIPHSITQIVNCGLDSKHVWLLC